MKKRTSVAEAELLLKLYDLRREPVMRQARGYVGGAFMPQSVDEFVEIVSKGGQETAFVLQVYGYWDMVSALVLHGTLSESLVYDTCQEMYFQYAKIAPYLREFREKMNLPEFMDSLQQVIDSSVKGRKRIATMRKNMERMRKSGACRSDQRIP